MANFKRPTTVDLINNGKYPNAATGTIIETLGYTSKGDGGGAQWKKTGVTGLTVSQSPAQRGTAKLNDANGHEWELAPDELRPDYLGADPTGVVDSTAAINACFSVVRASKVGNYVFKNVTFTPGGNYLCLSSVNATNIRTFNFSVIGNGAAIISHATGKVAWDMTHSRFSYTDALTIFGDEINTPLVGFQIGRGAAQVASANHLHNVTVDGWFTRTSFYNFASEICQYSHCRFWNRDAGAGSYCVIMDGDNTWDISSDYFPVTVAQPEPSSFNEQLFLNVDARKLNGGPAIWMKRTHRHHWYGCYAVSIDDAGLDLVFDSSGHKGAHLDIHFESSNGNPSLQECVRISGASTCVLEDFTFIDHSPHCATSVFDASDAGVTSVIMVKPDIRVPQFNQALTSGLMNPKAKFSTFGGTVYCGDSADYTNIGASYSDVLVDDMSLSSFGPGAYKITDIQAGGVAVQKGKHGFYSTSSSNVSGPDLLAAHYTTVEDGTIETSRSLKFANKGVQHLVQSLTDQSAALPMIIQAVHDESGSPSGTPQIQVRVGGISGTTEVSRIQESRYIFFIPVEMPEYTVATLPGAAGRTGGTIYVSDEVGGGVLAFSDGTNWRRVTDRAVVS